MIRFYRYHYKLQAEKWRNDGDHLWYELGKANDTLQRNPYDPSLQNKVGECKQGLLKFEQCKVESQEIRSQTKWREKGDTMTKEIFEDVKERSQFALLKEWEDDNGQEVS